MKICYKQQANEIKNGDACDVTAYQLNESMIDCAIAKINGRHPESGYVLNEKCKELAYVQEGSGQIIIESKKIPLNVGDVILIEAGEKYFWEGKMNLFISCTPAWYPEQHKHIEQIKEETS